MIIIGRTYCFNNYNAHNTSVLSIQLRDNFGKFLASSSMIGNKDFIKDCIEYNSINFSAFIKQRFYTERIYHIKDNMYFFDHKSEIRLRKKKNSKII